MSDPIRVLLLGATGLIGRTVIARSPDLPNMILQGLARREIEFPPGTRMELILAEGKNWPSAIEQLTPDGIICALGTTRRKAGSMEAFRAVDHDLVLSMGEAAKAAGVPNFVHISSVGADPYSRNSYLQVKGQTERDLKALRLRRLDILRPGLLIGKRKDDLRPVEKLGQIAAPLTDLFLQGDKSKYRSIRATTLADAALAAATIRAGGQFIHEHNALLRLAREFDKKLVPQPANQAAA